MQTNTKYLSVGANLFVRLHCVQQGSHLKVSSSKMPIDAQSSEEDPTPKGHFIVVFDVK